MFAKPYWKSVPLYLSLLPFAIVVGAILFVITWVDDKIEEFNEL